MISGTLKISLIIGPINGHFWARGPRIYGFAYTKILQKILESIWEHLGKYYFYIYENHFFENVRFVRKANPPFSLKPILYIFEYIILNYILPR